jgi:hypothetical protein
VFILKDKIITMAKLERRKWTRAHPKNFFLAAVFFAACSSSLSLIFLVSVSRESGTLPGEDFLLSTQARVLGRSTVLAYQQSYGFFDDIPDESWKLMQQRALKFSSLNYGNSAFTETTADNPDESYLRNMQVSSRLQWSLLRPPLSYLPSSRLTH